MVRKAMPIIAFLCILVILCIGRVYLFSASKSLNVILITIDALRADHLSCYGYTRETSPFLDSFAKGAFLFERSIAQSGSTVPSIASLFTSRYPFSDCIVSKNYTLETPHATIAEFLHTKGYDTYAITGHTYVSSKFGFAKGFDYFNGDPLHVSYANDLTSKAINLLKYKRTKKKFFLWVHYREPHAPYKPPSEYKNMFITPGSASQEMTSSYTIHGGQEDLSENDIKDLTASYDANIRFVDDNLRKLFDYLKGNGLLSKSIVIITADHGESLGEHHIFDHNELYFGILRVPLIIKIPNTKGRVIQYPVASIDIFPTIAELLGYQKDPLIKHLRGKNVFTRPDRQEGLYSEYTDRRSLIHDNYQLLCNAKGGYELYDIVHDKDETQNLTSTHKETLELLKRKIRKILECSNCTTAEGALLGNRDQEIKDAIRSLGYLQ